MTELPTKEKLDELEALAKAAQKRREAGIVGLAEVTPETLLSLIAAARRVEAQQWMAWEEGWAAHREYTHGGATAGPANPYRQPKGKTK